MLFTLNNLLFQVKPKLSSLYRVVVLICCKVVLHESTLKSEERQIFVQAFKTSSNRHVTCSDWRWGRCEATFSVKLKVQTLPVAQKHTYWHNLPHTHCHGSNKIRHDKEQQSEVLFCNLSHQCVLFPCCFLSSSYLPDWAPTGGKNPGK